MSRNFKQEPSYNRSHLEAQAKSLHTQRRTGPWSKREDERLYVLRRMMPMADVAVELGRSYRSCTNRLAYLRRKKRKLQQLSLAKSLSKLNHPYQN